MIDCASEIKSAMTTAQDNKSLEALRDPPVFKERPPWWGGDLQTIRNTIINAPAPLSSKSKRIFIAVSDGSGDQLLGALETPHENPIGPLVVLIHGLTGCEDSRYILASAKFHLQRSRRVLRLNLRGAGPSRKTCGGYYHAGCSSDIRDALNGLDDRLTSKGLFLIGYSLGGNVLIRLLAGDMGGASIVGAATVSAPINPLQAITRVSSLRNTLYHRWLLRRMKAEVLASDALGNNERQVIMSSKSIYEFDDQFIAPRAGFKDASEYYRETAGIRVVGDVNVPLLMIHARNDPWIPVAPYLELKYKNQSNLLVSVVSSGGHTGFHAKDSLDTWHDRYINMFLEHIYQ